MTIQIECEKCVKLDTCSQAYLLFRIANVIEGRSILIFDEYKNDFISLNDIADTYDINVSVDCSKCYISDLFKGGK